MPRAYIEIILSSKPVQRVCRFPTILGSNVAWRSRGVSNSNSPNSPFSVFSAFPVAWIALMVPARIVLFIAQMLAHLGFQRPLQHRLGQLFEQPVFPDDLLGALIILQQLIDQRLVDSHE